MAIDPRILYQRGVDLPAHKVLPVRMLALPQISSTTRLGHSP